MKSKGKVVYVDFSKNRKTTKESLYYRIIRKIKSFFQLLKLVSTPKKSLKNKNRKSIS